MRSRVSLAITRRTRLQRASIYGPGQRASDDQIGTGNPVRHRTPDQHYARGAASNNSSRKRPATTCTRTGTSWITPVGTARSDQA